MIKAPQIQLKKTTTEPDPDKMAAFLGGAKAVSEDTTPVHVTPLDDEPRALFDDLYKRHTVFILNDLDAKIKKAIKKKGKGAKTKIINDALAVYFAMQETKE